LTAIIYHQTKKISRAGFVFPISLGENFPHFFNNLNRVLKNCAILIKCNYIYILRYKKIYFSTGFFTDVVKIMHSDRERATFHSGLWLLFGPGRHFNSKKVIFFLLRKFSFYILRPERCSFKDDIGMKF